MFRHFVAGNREPRTVCEQRATEARLEAREAEDLVLGVNDGLEQGQKPRGQSPGMRKRQK